MHYINYFFFLILNYNIWLIVDWVWKMSETVQYIRIININKKVNSTPPSTRWGHRSCHFGVCRPSVKGLFWREIILLFTNKENITIFLRGKLVLYPNAYLQYCCNKVTLNSYPIGKLIDNYSLVILYCNNLWGNNLCFISW